jgi:hypothetical protein
MREDLRLSPLPPDPPGPQDILRPYPVRLLQAARAQRLRLRLPKRRRPTTQGLTESRPR